MLLALFSTTLACWLSICWLYLNGNGDLTYQQNVINDFVSLQNPLYPSGPRLNISIDFASVAKDIPILDVSLFTFTALLTSPCMESPTVHA